jgi:hypothetical protein
VAQALAARVGTARVAKGERGLLRMV